MIPEQSGTSVTLRQIEFTNVKQLMHVKARLYCYFEPETKGGGSFELHRYYNDLKYGGGGESIFIPQTKHMLMHFHAFILGVKCYESKCLRFSYCLCVVNGKQWEGVWRERKHLSHSSYPCEV